MEKTRLDELLAQQDVLRDMTNDQLNALKKMLSTLMCDEYRANQDSILWRTLWAIGDKVSNIMNERANEDVEEAFLAIIDHISGKNNQIAP